MSRRLSVPVLISAVFACALMQARVQAALAYWDSNGTTAASAAAPTGTWGTSNFWSPNSAGTAATVAWVNGNTAVFSAATQSTSAFTVTLSGTQTINGLTVEEGTPTITGGTALAINAVATPFNITNSPVINSVISGTGFGIAKSGAGTLILGGANTFSGGISVATGNVQFNAAGASGTGTLTVPTGSTGRFVINAGVTTTNNMVVESQVAGVAGRGVIERAGTGVAIFAGTMTLNGLTDAGGVIFGSNTAGNELRFNGPINGLADLGLSQRDGRVVYAGGGDLTGNFTVTGTVLVGATNGIPQGLLPQLGGSANGTLTLNGFDQALAGLILGNGGNSFVSTVNLGTNTLTLNGNVTSNSTAAQNVSHVITGTVGTAGNGRLDLGSVNRTITLSDSLAADDLTISGAILTAAGGFTKSGAGTLTLNNVTTISPITLAAGGLTIGSNLSNSITPLSLSLAAGTTLNLEVGTAGDLITSNVTSAGGTLNLTQIGGALPNGLYPIIVYTGATPGLANFTPVINMGHATGGLVDTGTAIAFQVTGNDTIYWDGSTSDWATGATGNWKLTSTNAIANFIGGDEVIFSSLPTSPNVSIAANVTPSKVTFNNASGTDYVISGAGGIIGTTGLTKNNTGGLTLGTPNTYTGITALNGGSLVANFTAGSAIPAASSITTAAGTTLTLAHDGGTFTLANPLLTGAGTVTIDPGLTIAGSRDIATVTWDASGFSGTLRLAPTTGTMRISANTPADIGSGPQVITAGGQIFVSAGNLTFPNNFTISGTGYSEAAGVLGAIRASNPTTFTGTLTLSGPAKIGALGGTANVTNTLTGGDLTFGGSINNTGSETLALTGDGSGLTSLTVNDGSATSSAATITVNVGNGTSTGTIGSVPVTLKPDGFKSAVIRFDRTDGYTLGAAVTSTATAAANEIRSFLDLDCTGTGFSDNGLTNTLGLATPAAGGRVRIGSTRANALATLSGSLTAETVQLATGQANATLNLGSGATLALNQFFAGESANNSGTINQVAGSNVNVLGQLRVGHFASETSTYNFSGGNLNLTGDSPTNSPSTAAAGGAGTNGDNNLNTAATATIVGGGVYLGIDGTGIFNHTGGTLSTNWIVLDNRVATGAGLNMVDGIDRYNLSATALLKLRSTHGLIGRNDGSYDVRLGGGTILVDDTGTGFGTGPNITVPIDAVLSTVASTTTTLDTNAAVNTGNAFTLTKDVNGTGTLALAGGGVVNLSSASFQSVSANLSGSTKLAKLGAGSTVITGSMSGFSGNVEVSAGRLDVPGSLDTSVTVKTGGTLSGDVSLASLTLDGGTLLCDPADPTSHSATALVLANGSNSTLDISGAPGGAAFTALTYSSKSGTGGLTVANSANYRIAPTLTDNLVSQITLQFFPGKNLTWTGAASAAWDINTAINWVDDAAVPLPERFFSRDSVTFPEGGALPAITLTGLIAPAGVSVTSATTNYSFTSTPGNLITGSTGLTKSGGSTLTLIGANAYTGATAISGGTLSFNDVSSIGSGVAGNTLSLSNGAKLSYTGATAINHGINRSITIGTGGGVLDHSNAAAVTTTIPGTLAGSGALSIQSTLAGGGTFAFTGNNSGYTGAITVGAVSTGQTTLRFNTAAAVPNASSITLNYPAASTTSGASSTLDLPPGTTLPAGTTLNLTSALPTAAISLRSSVITNGIVTIDGPIRLAGASIIQMTAVGGPTTFNGEIGESSPGSFVESPLQAFSNVWFLRGGTGSIVINGQINLPSAGSTVSVTDGATATINSTGNNFKSASAAFGTIRLGATNAIPTTARLVIGQAGNQNCTLDLNGFNQTVAGLEWQATSAAITKGISNTHPTNVSTFTVNQATAPLANFSGSFSGNVNLIKDGPATTTLSSNLSTSTGSVTVNNGTLVASGVGANDGANGPLGVANLAGRIITVNSGATLSFTTNNVFGNGVGNLNLPSLVINGGTLSSTRYNGIGNLTLNGATLTQAATDGPGAYEGFQFLGSVTAGGTGASTIASTNGRSNHLASNTQFIVDDAAVGNDLTVSAGLRNPSNDFPGAPGSLTKAGLGTMVLAGINTYTGNTVVNLGALVLADGAQLRFAIGATSGTNNRLTGSASISLEGDFAIDTIAAETLTTGSWLLEDATALPGAYGANFQVVTTGGVPWSNIGNEWTKSTPGGRKWTFNETTGTLSLTIAGFEAWATQIPNAADRDRADDPDGDGLTNDQEFLFGTSPIVNNGSLVTSDRSGANLVITWMQREFGASYLLKESTTLGAGAWSTSVVIPVLGNQTGVPADYDRFSATVPIDVARKFFRIEGTEN